VWSTVVVVAVGDRCRDWNRRRDRDRCRDWSRRRDREPRRDGSSPVERWW